jgi:hypothetical protein
MQTSVDTCNIKTSQKRPKNVKISVRKFHKVTESGTIFDKPTQTFWISKKYFHIFNS